MVLPDLSNNVSKGTLPMQEFSTQEVRHVFKIDGHVYWLAGVTIDDIEAIAVLSEKTETDQLTEFRNIMLDRVEPRRRDIWRWFNNVPSARRAVRSLTIKQLSDLFVAWSGFGKKTPLGESSALLVPQPTTDQN